MRVMGSDEPVNLPVQAIDHATGYLMATAAIRGLTTRMKEGVGTEVRASLARTAAELQLRSEPMSEVIELVADDQRDRAEHVEPTSWGRHPGSCRPYGSTVRRCDGFIRRARWVRTANGCRRTTICDAMR